MENKCFEFRVKNKVQNVGLRLAIAKQVPDELNVRTDNLPDGSVRVMVKGQEEDVRRFWKTLQKQVLGKAENPTFSEPREAVETSINTDRFFHKLQCEQMGKFVDVGLDMHEDMKGMRKDIKDLPENMAKEIVKLKGKEIL